MRQNVIYEARVDLDNEPRTIAAFERLRPKYAAIPATDLIAVNAHVTTVVAIIFAASRRIAALRDELLKFGGVDLSVLDELQLCADGLDYAEGEYRAAEPSPRDLSDLGQEGLQTREKFAIDLRNLVAQGEINGSFLNEYTGGPGFKNVIDDIRLLAQVYRNNWSLIAGKTCRTLEQLARAEAVIHRMAHLVGERELGETGPSHLADMRTRAFTYAVQRYDEARRVIAFARWREGDADKIAPSLWKNRGGKKRPQADQPVEAQPEQPTQAQPAFGPNGPFVPTDTASATPEPHIAGMPGGSPFIQ